MKFYYGRRQHKWKTIREMPRPLSYTIHIAHKTNKMQQFATDTNNYY